MLTPERSWWTALQGREAASVFCCPQIVRLSNRQGRSILLVCQPQETRRASEDTQLPKVLIVEDEPDMLLGLRDNCEYEGYEVLVASDGESGIQQTLQSHPDII